MEKIIPLTDSSLLLGIVNDKDSKAIVRLIAGKFKRIIITEPNTKRKQDGKELAALFESQGQKAEFIKDISIAYDSLFKVLKENETLLALGSHYLVGELLTC
jgi:dihydrofolate synthase/folylpolyglutamate synthase